MTQAPSAQPNYRAHLMAAAGLLHDAGKVFQPAIVELPSQIKNLQGMICPTGQAGRPTHLHVLYTAYALDQATSNYGGLDRRELFRIACYHHRPSGDSFEENLLTKADWLASGHDRRSAEEPGERVTGLRPVLAGLQWPNAEVLPASDRQIPTSPLSFRSDDFLPAEQQNHEAYSERCRELVRVLIDGLQVSFDSPADCIEGLLGLTGRVFHAVPASRDRRQQPDVNLFDHSRIVAAFAACLAVQHADGPCDPHKIAGRYRLVNVGLGGIQRFLVRAVPTLDAPPGESVEKGMARRLRARSFYISMLSWLAARRLLDAAGMPAVNILIDAGGRSMLLFPDVEPVLSRLQEAIQYVRHWFARHLGGIVRLDLAVGPSLDDAAFTQASFARTFRESDRLLGGARLQAPSPDLQEGGGWSTSGWVGNDLSMPVDRKEFDDNIVELGRALPNARYLSLDNESRGTGPVLEILGYRVQVHRDPPGSGRYFALGVHSQDAATTPTLITANHVPKARQDDLDRLQSKPGKEELLGEGHASTVGDPLTFQQLAELAADRSGRPIDHAMLGALKADVDRLGVLLGYGLGDRVSFGRFASMARSLDLFFKGFLDEQLQTRYPNVYTVFAGGDDLYLIGPWYDLVELLADLRSWFGQLTRGNRNLTFSAGLVFSRPTTPVRHLAARAEEALDQAKEKRNRVTFGSVTLPWPDYERAIGLHRLMCQLAAAPGERRGMNTSLAYRLLKYGKMPLGDFGRKPKPSAADLKWRSQLSYDVKRNLPEPTDENSPLARLHEQLLKIRTADDARVLYVASALTLYFLRGVPS